MELRVVCLTVDPREFRKGVVCNDEEASCAFTHPTWVSATGRGPLQGRHFLLRASGGYLARSSTLQPRLHRYQFSCLFPVLTACLQNRVAV
jgi:hypothetical protein